MKTTEFLFSTLVFIALVLLASCTKDTSSELLQGKYSGTFMVVYASGPEFGQVELEMTDSTFSCSGNNDFLPAGGSGKYSFDKGKISFQDENFWTADFDWNLILKGKYHYNFDGHNLKLSTTHSTGYYEYNLVKQ